MLHSLRHSIGTAGIVAGMSTAEIQSMLRHRNIATTQRYVHLAEASQSRLQDRASDHLMGAVRADTAESVPRVDCWKGAGMMARPKPRRTEGAGAATGWPLGLRLDRAVIRFAPNHRDHQTLARQLAEWGGASEARGDACGAPRHPVGRAMSTGELRRAKGHWDSARGRRRKRDQARRVAARQAGL